MGSEGDVLASRLVERPHLVTNESVLEQRRGYDCDRSQGLPIGHGRYDGVSSRPVEKGEASVAGDQRQNEDRGSVAERREHEVLGIARLLERRNVRNQFAIM